MPLRTTYVFVFLLALSFPLKKSLKRYFRDSGRSHSEETVLSVTQDRNRSPSVRILEPPDNSVHPRNAMLRYSISVSDPEDGESKFDELPAQRIFLRVEYREGKGAPRRKARDPDNELKTAEGFRLVQHADCFNCHQFKSKSIGPSFADIASRYTTENNSSSAMADKIIRGSQARWGNEIMPAHPDLSSSEAESISRWILSAPGDGRVDYLRGKEGTMKLEAPEGSEGGYFILTAIYTDSGMQGKNKSSSEVSIRIHLQ